MFEKVHNQKGMTLIELLAAVALTSMIGLVTVQVFSSQNKLYSGERYISRNISHTRIIIDALAKNIRQIGYNPMETDGNVFGIKDSTGSFTTNAITSNTSLYYTEDDDEDGVLDTNMNEKVSISYDSVNNILRLGDIDNVGAITWANKWPNVTAFSISYIYSDGTSSSGTTDLPDNTTSNHTYSLIMAIVVSVTTRTEEIHTLTGSYVEETVESTVLLRNGA